MPKSKFVNDQAHPYLAQIWLRQCKTGDAACGAATPQSWAGKWPLLSLWYAPTLFARLQSDACVLIC
eukprot:5665812-Pleurochrysis_carterae.AAC.1